MANHTVHGDPVKVLMTFGLRASNEGWASPRAEVRGARL